MKDSLNNRGLIANPFYLSIASSLRRTYQVTHASFRGLWHKCKQSQTEPHKEDFSQMPAKKVTGLPDYME
jgi:hypothetical protein